MIEKLSPVIKTKNGSRYPNTFDLTEKLNEIIDYLNKQCTNKENTYTVSKEFLLQVLSVLGYATFNTPDINDSLRHKLIDMSDDLQWDIAEMFDIDLHEGNIDPFTLKFEEF